MTKQKVINLYGGPNSGKSRTAAALFAELKSMGVRCEYVQEYAKDATWEGRGPKVFSSQEYIFGKQHMRMRRLVGQVDYIITDSPLLTSLAYIDEKFDLPSIGQSIIDAYRLYDNLDIMMVRNLERPYEQYGRIQNLQQAQVVDDKITNILSDANIMQSITWRVDNNSNAISKIFNCINYKWDNNFILDRTVSLNSVNVVLPFDGELVRAFTADSDNPILLKRNVYHDIWLMSDGSRYEGAMITHWMR